MGRNYALGAMQPKQGDIDLRLRGRAVSRLFIDHRLGLEFLEHGVETTLVVGGRSRLKHGGAWLELSADNSQEVGKASILVRKTTLIGIFDIIRVVFPTRMEGGHGGETFKIAVACAANLKGFTPEKI